MMDQVDLSVGKVLVNGSRCKSGGG